MVLRNFVKPSERFNELPVRHSQLEKWLLRIVKQLSQSRDRLLLNRVNLQFDT